jgi:hypothetical protein
VPLEVALDALNAPLPRDSAETRRVQVVGRVVNGRIELDQATMAEFAQKFPDAELTFLAVSAPFDPVPAAAR